MTGPDPQVAAFVAGALVVGFLTAGLFFLKFWRQTHDSLFLAFAAAFALMALNHGLVALLGIPREEQTPLYLLRLAAFVLIIWAVLRKNMGRSRS